MSWMNPMLQKKVEYREGDTIIAVPAKSGTTWAMNIFHQLRSGGDPDLKDVYAEVPWLEFIERPDQKEEELLERWKAMPGDVPRGFKSHASPGPMMDFHETVKYVVVVRNPEEAICSLYPFFQQHSDEIWDLWSAHEMRKGMLRDNFQKWFEEVVLSFKPGPEAPDIPGGMLTMFFFSFVNAWWPLRKKPNVCFLHFADMKRDHEGSVRKIADFLGFAPTPEQWPKILEYTSFKWMKAHEGKFEAATIAPVPILKTGAMIRKGETGRTSEDGLTPEMAATIRDWAEKIVTDEAARKWMYEGGPLQEQPAAPAVEETANARGKTKPKERFEARFFKPLPANTAAQDAATRVYSQGNVMKRTDPYVTALDRNGQKFTECAWRTSEVSTVLPLTMGK